MPAGLSTALTALLAAIVLGCGSSSDGTTDTPASDAHQAQARAKAKAKARAAHRRQARIRARLQAHRTAIHQEQAEQHQAESEDAEARLAEKESAASEEASSECDPNYSGCLSPAASDYDCEGGSGDGPEYTGTVTVTGEDHYGLDSDSDRVGCEID